MVVDSFQIMKGLRSSARIVRHGDRKLSVDQILSILVVEHHLTARAKVVMCRSTLVASVNYPLLLLLSKYSWTMRELNLRELVASLQVHLVVDSSRERMQGCYKSKLRGLQGD